MGRGLSSTPSPRIERISPNDLTNLAVDHGPAPMNIAAVLVVERGDEVPFDAVRRLLSERLPRVRRLRQRLESPPICLGRPYWVDDPTFDLDAHLDQLHLDQRHLEPAEPGPSGSLGEPAREDRRLLEAAASVIGRRLAPDRPLWAARWVTGVRGNRAALVLVVHHVLADGLGGLAVLAALGDEGHDRTTVGFPGPGPSARALAVDAWRERTALLVGLRHALVGARQGLRELGLTQTRPSLAPTTALNRPTGPDRRLTTVGVPLDDVVDLAHARGCTVNDVVLTAIVGAIADSLRQVGDAPERLVVSVPVSARPGTTTAALGNETGVVPMSLPTTREASLRLDQVAAISRERRGAARASSAGPTGVAFRALARVGLFQAFIERQRLVNTFVTNVRGPAEALSLGGHRVMEVIPVAVNPGNVGVSFDVLSYAGRLGITVVADPDVVPDQNLLTRLLADELTGLLNPSA